MAFPTAPGPGYGSDPAEASIISATLGWLGAGLSLTLVIGLVWWAYDIATRDTRTVPVIRAMEGPARLAPADPGGFRAAHTGYSVNEIAAETPRSPVADEVAIAPAPTAVEQNDSPVMRPGAAPDREVMRNSVDRALFDA
ncbi:MAG: hypothetical protein OIF40_15440, partial [Mangrovicoccus sp.]|nr:hypothetical protein [Mangrovicoccus sp.]